MGIVNEFREFVARGNVVDMAVSVIIGLAFGQIVSSLVSDVVMPPIGLLIGGVDFSDLMIVLREAENGVAAVTINYGTFIKRLVDFLIIAALVFAAIKMIARLLGLKRREARARADELLGDFDLREAGQRPAQTYSGGMRRRLAGRILADVVKQLLCIALLLAVGFLLGFRLETSWAHLLAMVALVLAFAVAFSWVMVLVGVIARDPEHVQLFGFTALFPVTFVSSAFVPVDTVPTWLQGFVQANPVSLLADAARGLMNADGPALEPALGSLAWALGIALVFAPLSVYMLNRRLAHG